jgi:hypothetical protein
MSDDTAVPEIDPSFEDALLPPTSASDIAEPNVVAAVLGVDAIMDNLETDPSSPVPWLLLLLKNPPI